MQWLQAYVKKNILMLSDPICMPALQLADAHAHLCSHTLDTDFVHHMILHPHDDIYRENIGNMMVYLSLPSGWSLPCSCFFAFASRPFGEIRRLVSGGHFFDPPGLFRPPAPLFDYRARWWLFLCFGCYSFGHRLALGAAAVWRRAARPRVRTVRVPFGTPRSA